MKKTSHLQFCVDGLISRTPEQLTFKYLQNQIFEQHQKDGDLVVLLSQSYLNKNKRLELGYLLKNNSKFITHFKIWLIAFKLYAYITYVSKIKVKTNAHGS